MSDAIQILNGVLVSGPPCHVCGARCARWERIDPFGKSDRMRLVCDDHAAPLGLTPRIFPMPHNPAPAASGITGDTTMLDTVRAKFRCSYVAPSADGSARIYMSAVYSDDPNSENKKFSDATPDGNFQMTIKAGGPIGHFENGKDYYLDFTKAE
jgi:hypothetical protein